MIKSIRNKKKGLLFFLVIMAVFACDQDYQDASMSLLKKPELLSIVLEPPEAAPGQVVEASFLMADDKGVVENAQVIWLPEANLAVQGGRRRSDEQEWMSLDEGLDPELMEPIYQFEVGDASQYEFDEQGLAEHSIGLVALLDGINIDEPDEKELDFQTLISDTKAKLAIRTLIVSERDNPNQNPKVREIVWGNAASEQDKPIVLVRSYDTEVDEMRLQAFRQPIQVKEKSEIYFKVRVQDDDSTKEAIRYQWIATGGDFGGYRQRVQKFEVPDYQDDEPEEKEEPATDARIDSPNLYAVWVILRDDGIDQRTGQAWAEFYVEVLPADEK